MLEKDPVAKQKTIVFGNLSVDPDRMRSVLIEQRTRLGLSHRALADLAGVAPTTVHNLERGNHRVQLDKFLAVLGALQLVPNHIIEVDGTAEELPPSALEDELREIASLSNPDEVLRRLARLVERTRQTTKKPKK
jgi:transcriptional regulator with XRE-family HTH domain